MIDVGTTVEPEMIIIGHNRNDLDIWIFPILTNITDSPFKCLFIMEERAFNIWWTCGLHVGIWRTLFLWGITEQWDEALFHSCGHIQVQVGRNAEGLFFWLLTILPVPLKIEQNFKIKHFDTYIYCINCPFSYSHDCLICLNILENGFQN